MSNIVSIINGEALTTSLAISEGVDRPHASLLKLIREHQSDFEEFGLVRFEIRPRLDGQHGGGNTEYALLNEHQATLLITFMRNIGIVKEFKKQLVKAFYELASRQPKELSRLEILQIAIDAEKENQALAHKIEQDAPKVEFHDKVSTPLESISVGQAAKILGTGRNRLFMFLRQIKWLNRKNEPYQAKIEAGLLDVKISNYEDEAGTLKDRITALVTGKGLSKLQQLISEGVAA